MDLARGNPDPGTIVDFNTNLVGLGPNLHYTNVEYPTKKSKIIAYCAILRLFFVR